jgi:hypothetical protein
MLDGGRNKPINRNDRFQGVGRGNSDFLIANADVGGRKIEYPKSSILHSAAAG